jgi:hypothetical protein
MNTDNDRNIPRRYPISLAIRYVTASPAEERTGVGETVWMSGAEVAFLAKGPAGIGDKVTMSIEWPVLLEGETRLQLTVAAQIIQRSGPLNIAKLTKHEFRTRGHSSSTMGERTRLALPIWEKPATRRMPAAQAIMSAPDPQLAFTSAAAG